MLGHPPPTSAYSRHLALAVVLLAQASGCASSSEPGTRVRFVSAGTALTAGEELDGGENGPVRIDALLWTSAELELVPCNSAWRRLKRWLLPTAHAHGISTPTRVASPIVESASTLGDVSLGELSPPAGRYCGLRYRLAPADADALGVVEAPAMLGKSYLLRGSVRGAGGVDEPLELSSTLVVDVELPLELELDGDEREAIVRLERSPARWFEGPALEPLTSAERELVLLDAFRRSLTATVE